MNIFECITVSFVVSALLCVATATDPFEGISKIITAWRKK